MKEHFGLSIEEFAALAAQVDDPELRPPMDAIVRNATAAPPDFHVALGRVRVCGEALLWQEFGRLLAAKAPGFDERQRKDYKTNLPGLAALLVKEGAMPRRVGMCFASLVAWGNEGAHPSPIALLERDLEFLLAWLVDAANYVRGRRGLAPLAVARPEAAAVLRAQEAPEHVRRVVAAAGIQHLRPALGGLELAAGSAWCFWRPLEGDARDEARFDLRPYSFEQHGRLCGRDDVRDRVADQVAREPLLVLTGGSGVGKTSLARASLVPRLLEAGRAVLYVHRWAAESWRLAAEALASLRADDVLVLDQFDEALASGAAGADGGPLAALLRRLDPAEGPRPRVVLVLRDDQEGALRRAMGELAPGLLAEVRYQRHFVDVPPLSLAQAEAVWREERRRRGQPDDARLLGGLCERDGSVSTVLLRLLLDDAESVRSRAEDAAGDAVEAAIALFVDRALGAARPWERAALRVLEAMSGAADERVWVDDELLAGLAEAEGASPEGPALGVVLARLMERRLVVMQRPDRDGASARYGMVHDRVVPAVRARILRQQEHDPDALERALAQTDLDRALYSERRGRPEVLNLQQLRRVERHRATLRVAEGQREAERAVVRRARQRIGLLAGTAAALALAAVLGAAVGAVQYRRQVQARERADHARRVADANRARAEGLVSYMVYDLREALDRYVPQETREQISSRVAQYYREVGGEGLARDDASLRREMAGQILSSAP